MSKSRFAFSGAVIFVLTATVPGGTVGAELPIKQVPATAALPDQQAKPLPPFSDGANGAVILLDEADSVYGHRKDVPTTNDRYSTKDE